MTKLEKLEVLKGEGPFEVKCDVMGIDWQELTSMKVLTLIQEDDWHIRVKPLEPELETGQTVVFKESSGLPHRFLVDSIAMGATVSNVKPYHSAPQWIMFKPWNGGECPKECRDRLIVTIDRDGCGGVSFNEPNNNWHHSESNPCEDVVWYAVIYKFMTESM